MTTSQPARDPGPDLISNGFVAEVVDPLRYDGQSDEPDEVVSVILDMVPQGARVLDVGCGTGSVSSIVQSRRNASVVGIEPDERRAARARERGIDTRTALLSADVIGELGSFDVVLFADVLEHLPDPLSALRLARTALAPDGVIVASVPNIAHWSVRTELLRGRFTYRKWGIMDGTHLRWFTDANLHFLFTTAGLAITRERVTAGVDLDCYSERLPWRRLSRPTRARIIRRAIRIWPRLFGCQLVASARIADATSGS